jgi:DNA modification methylase
MGMYLIKFRKPGENKISIDSTGQVSRNDWIDWAECSWDIRETDTLNTQEGKDKDDTKHICPMQLGIYERLIRLYSNPGEIVFDPFAGIGSCGFVSLGGSSPVTGKSILDSRRFYGCELKDSYYQAALKNCERAINSRAAKQVNLFQHVGGM